jgi:hypothetical protein
MSLEEQEASWDGLRLHDVAQLVVGPGGITTWYHDNDGGGT